eukprot:scaffold129196_cov69-Phaeocystis_antarctica.AAC.4
MGPHGGSGGWWQRSPDVLAKLVLVEVARCVTRHQDGKGALVLLRRAHPRRCSLTGEETPGWSRHPAALTNVTRNV